MKKTLFLGLGSLCVLTLGGCTLSTKNTTSISTGDLVKASELESQLQNLMIQFSGLQAENLELKEYLSGAVGALKDLKMENEELKDDINTYQQANQENNTNSTTTNSDGTTPIIQIATTKEIGLIKRIYVDQFGNNKLEIDYVQLGGQEECNGGVSCIINQNPQLRTFSVSDDVEIVMQTLSHTSDGSFNNGQKIGFDYFLEKFNDTTQYENYPHNYSNFLKAIPFWITIEQNNIIQIEEQYMS